MGVNNKIISSLLLWLLLLCAVVIPTSPSKHRPSTDVADSRGARSNKKWKDAHHRSSTLATTTLSSSSHYGGPPQREEKQTTSSDRRVIPWVSIAILMNILFFFRSFAAPFFDPLVSVVCPPHIFNNVMIWYQLLCLSESSLFITLFITLYIGRTTSSHRLLRLLFSPCLPLPLVSLRDSINGTSSVLYQLQYHHCGGIVLLHGIR